MPVPLVTWSKWLQSLMPPAPQKPWPELNLGPYIPEMPNQLITITPLDGIGFVMEGAGDSPNLQIRVRSEQNDQSSGESVAFAIDTAIYGAHFPVLVDDYKILLVTRLAGQPSPLGPPDDAYRYDYVCTYRTVTGV